MTRFTINELATLVALAATLDPDKDKLIYTPKATAVIYKAKAVMADKDAIAFAFGES
jgi:hypothetical protein